MAHERDVPSTRPRLDKLGVKPNARVALLNVDEPDFLRELETRTGSVFVQRRRTQLDLLFVGLADRWALSRIRTQRPFIKPDGAIWALWPKGSKDINENDVRDAALAAGLVDVKVVSFSDRLSALKLVIRSKDR